MAKILKYCNSCEEGFAERFTYCPVCGASLQAVELNPVAAAASEDKVADQPATPPAFIAEEVVETEFSEPTAFEQPEIVATSETETVLEAFIDEPVEEPEIFADDAEVAAEIEEEEVEFVPPVAPVTPTPVYHTPAMHADAPRSEVSSSPIISKEDDGFYVTVIQEKNVKQRNALLLGSTAFVIVTMLGAWGYSLFHKDLGVASIGDEGSLARLIDDVPMPVEAEPEREDEDEGGGGGGGGRDEKDPASRGDMADQTPKPVRPPDVNTPRLTNPSIELPPPSTQGNQKFPKENDRWGLNNSKLESLSNGTGTGGGIGSGTGTGQGSGRGTGAGSGSGSGFGGGIGDGNGDGTGPGGGPPPRPKPPTGVTTNYRIISQPRAGYTEAARVNNVQGTVRLKVTLLGSGQVGSITPVTRLPHGLTEQAIAAARLIKFEPKKVNGVPTAVSLTLDYGFTIY